MSLPNDEQGPNPTETATAKRRGRPKNERQTRRDSPEAISTRGTAPRRPDPESVERPPFLRDYPHDAALDALVAAFERGDYRTVRRQAPRLAERAGRADIRRAALDLRRRVDPDPLAVTLLGIAVALLGFLLLWTYLLPHHH